MTCYDQFMFHHSSWYVHLIFPYPQGICQSRKPNASRSCSRAILPPWHGCSASLAAPATRWARCCQRRSRGSRCCAAPRSRRRPCCGCHQAMPGPLDWGHARAVGWTGKYWIAMNCPKNTLGKYRKDIEKQQKAIEKALWRCADSRGMLLGQWFWKAIFWLTVACWACLSLYLSRQWMSMNINECQSHLTCSGWIKSLKDKNANDLLQPKSFQCPSIVESFLMLFDHPKASNLSGMVYELQLDFLEAQGLHESVQRARAAQQRVAVCLPRILKPNEVQTCANYTKHHQTTTCSTDGRSMVSVSRGLEWSPSGPWWDWHKWFFSAGPLVAILSAPGSGCCLHQKTYPVYITLGVCVFNMFQPVLTVHLFTFPEAKAT